MQAHDCVPGEPWACQFRTHTFLDEQGMPTQAKNLQLGQAHPGTPGVYQGIGLVKTRDLANNLVELVDVQSELTFIVSIDDTWAYDRAE